ncbi:MAG: hypothetical protein AVDCRST_MAG67-2499 [uncultured Solirubrobacteraceae bacterium]|uniref:Transglycosylase SLT domain-containing protein n=1 Tax=uncultured Solirubrobacteraceae bacterium TaxID=1162706 RepID=A0A6J4SWH8_9ACTN|nr:MAG: hypothetical protein AVDCRST_MAG67-2499 [uncultured Solirubrobacteraceae bacterium]
MIHARSAGSRRRVLVAPLILAALTFLLAAAQADAGHRCGHKGKTCAPPADTTPPDTTITSGPSGTISSGPVSFSFSSNESASTFECRLDASSWAACSSPKSYSAPASGGHTFEVRAKDAVGNLDASPAARSFTIQSTTGTTPPPPSGAKATTTAAGAPVLADADAAARVTRSSFEPRSINAQANQRRPSAGELSHFFTYSPNWGPCAETFKARITGNFTGTTDEIIQWAAHKWGIDEDITRAVAVKESNWNQDARGDWDSNIQDFQSYGLTQVRRNSGGLVAPNWNGTFPLSRDSTAFNLDYWGASVRQYYEGCATWLHDVGDNGATYAAGDIWGSVGAWYAGRWWNAGAQWYIGDVKTNLTNRTWAQPGF